MNKGRIVKHLADFYYVELGSELVECKAKGIFRLAQSPVVGDWVLLDDKKEVITKIFPRKNLLHRPVVANVDYLLIFLAIDEPMPDYLMIDKLLMISKYYHIEPMILVNKTDLSKRTLEVDYPSLGTSVYYFSLYLQDDMKEFIANLPSGLYVLAGPSGAGKSSFINHISHMELKTGKISEKISRGRHTTRHNQLIEIRRDLFMADTPGFQQVALPSQMKREELSPLFYGDRGCKFADCTHRKEPGCVVKDLVKEEQLSSLRYENYLYMMEELEGRKKW